MSASAYNGDEVASSEMRRRDRTIYRLTPRALAFFFWGEHEYERDTDAG